ncbi:MAG TPA: YtxH domain-containing protein [Candidatus Eisenbacteria bacterium]|nr:YtxH domain-containing protein [Candidatus Eisenbacteria bacterium]
MHELQNLDIHGTGRKVKPNFLVGALVGAGLALLLAPAAGRDTRQRLGSTAKKLGGNARNVFGRTRESIRGIKDDARSAMERGREEYRRSREARGTSGAWSPTS